MWESDWILVGTFIRETSAGGESSSSNYAEDKLHHLLFPLVHRTDALWGLKAPDAARNPRTGNCLTPVMHKVTLLSVSLSPSPRTKMRWNASRLFFSRQLGANCPACWTWWSCGWIHHRKLEVERKKKKKKKARVTFCFRFKYVSGTDGELTLKHELLLFFFCLLTCFWALGFLNEEFSHFLHPHVEDALPRVCPVKYFPWVTARLLME